MVAEQSFGTHTPYSFELCLLEKERKKINKERKKMNKFENFTSGFLDLDKG